MVAYDSRLLLLSAAAFFLVHAAVAAVALLLAPGALRLAGRTSPRGGAGLILALRLAPAGLALIVVMAFAVPSYLWLEPAETGEQAGDLCWCAAIFGAAIWTVSLARACRAVVRTRRCTSQWTRSGHEVNLRGETVWLVESAAPILAVTGIVHPRLVVSRGVVAALSPRQLAAALRHERAHRESGDNLKRLLLCLAPGILPFRYGFEKLDRAWARLAEQAADDRASLRSPRRSVVLAEALVRVARLGAPAFVPLATSFSGDTVALAERVERLLRTDPMRRNSGPAAHFLLFGLMTALALLALQPAVLRSVHRWLELLMD